MAEVQAQGEHDASPPPTAAPLWIERLVFSDGTQVDLQPGHIVLIVGPNNVGKSQTLRQIEARLGGNQIPGYNPVREVRLSHSDPDGSATRDWVRSHFRLRWLPNGVEGYSDGSGNRVPAGQLEQLSKQASGGTSLGQLGRLLTLHADADRRLALASPANPIDLDSQPPERAIQAIYGDSDAIRALSTACNEAFGAPLVFDHYGGTWQLRIGNQIEWRIDPETGFPTPETKEALRDHLKVQEQGHGIRSYIGLLTDFLGTRHLFVLVDEPEAFLHPPQSRMLGKHLTTLKRPATQVLVATHSATLLTGVLDASRSNDAPVTVVRLARGEGDSTVSVLHQDQLRNLWEDPVLRYSNILEGIFHHAVVICESDPDCSLYEALSDVHGLGHPGHDPMFVQAGGAGRIPVVAHALSAVGVPAAAIVDADLLLQPDAIAGIAQSLASPLSDETRALIARTELAIRQKLGEEDRSVADLQEALSSALPAESDAPVTSSLTKRIRKLLEGRSSSSPLKDHGLGLLSGQQRTDAIDLLQVLGRHGVFVVPVGELERWFPEAGSHGTRHVANVFEGRLHEDGDRSREAVNFVRSVLDYFETNA